MPNSPRNPHEEFLSGPRIPQAIRWDVDAISTPKTNSELNPLGLGHMMPSPETFSAACKERGIRKEDHVVVYDSVGVFSAPRAAFTFDVSCSLVSLGLAGSRVPRYGQAP
jgi:thiosulfate/3-mercaptopyruvate sulfurtransferase